ncbi:hypothetical protein [Methylobacterium sp. Leaf361]|uniref:hypothetical protein n=1 Tax=Methylobacterium sp. Leaf361 TaxID=1736352 RepID=UPI0012FE8484|nr:hypothetical protein [Methylobacterium sp. Leaf361]
MFEFARHVRTAQTYLAGSVAKESPYEMGYCLRKALPRWTSRRTIITTALTSGHDFHLQPADPWQFITKTITGYDAGGYDPLLVLIGVPRIYRHKPVFCIPLYHELGHFVDNTLGVCNYSLLKLPPPTPAHRQLEWYHRREYFADLFCACYTGRASARTLETIAPNAPPSLTHPATAVRVALIEDFLAGRTNQIIDHLQECLMDLGAPALMPLFTLPDISENFNDMRPFVLNTDEHLHGIFEAAWDYLGSCLDARMAPWIAPNFTESDIERIVNDLSEKTIRNMSIRERWSSAVAS